MLIPGPPGTCLFSGEAGFHIHKAIIPRFIPSREQGVCSRNSGDSSD